MTFTIGAIFPCIADLKIVIRQDAIAHKYEVRVVKFDTHRYTIVCSKSQCPWCIHASKLADTNGFVIKVANIEATYASRVDEFETQIAHISTIS